MIAKRKFEAEKNSSFNDFIEVEDNEVNIKNKEEIPSSSNDNQEKSDIIFDIKIKEISFSIRTSNTDSTIFNLFKSILKL